LEKVAGKGGDQSSKLPFDGKRMIYGGFKKFLAM
jgi:uncharacterized protein YbaA (DUF1428 family)